VLAVDRGLEVAQATAERSSHLGQPLGTEHKQRDDQDE
jgi:hypothetical protein